MSKEFKINLDVGNRFWTPKGLGAMGMDPHRAIAELVANSLDWRVNEDSIIKIIIAKNYIQILDNGIGMTAVELQNAIQVSVSNDDVRKNIRIRKGMFGMGMKVACLTLGWKINIHTKSITYPDYEQHLFLDTRKLDNNDQLTSSKGYRGNIKGNSTEIKNINYADPLSEWTSGTSIKIDDLTHKSLNPILVRDSLQEIFNPEIGIEGVKLLVIDEINEQEYLCKKVEVPIVEDSKIILDELNLFVKSDDTNELVQITGWVGLLKTAGSGSGKWGLHLFKNNQIIERYHQLPIRLGGLMPKNPHPNYARTYGEINLDMCRPAFHKIGFDYSTSSWLKVQELLEEHIRIIMDASHDYRANDHEKAEKSIKAVQKHKRAAKKAVKKIGGKNKSNSNDKNDLIAPDNAIILPDDQWFVIVEPIFDDLNDKVKPWIHDYREDSHELSIIINKKSSIYENYEIYQSNELVLETIVNWAISECLFVILYERYDFTMNEAIAFRNEQLIKLFSNNDNRL